jgi:hypothetical protein
MSRDDEFVLRLRCFEVSVIDPRQQWRSTCDDTHIPRSRSSVLQQLITTWYECHFEDRGDTHRALYLSATSMTRVAVAGQTESDRKAVPDEI